jgi:hypothetical protein
MSAIVLKAFDISYLSLENLIKKFSLMQCTGEAVNDPTLFVSFGRIR